MTLKATWLWNGSAASGKYAFGFSETWYTDDSVATLLPKMRNLARTMSAVRARDTVLYGYRIADTAPNSRAFTQLEPSVIGAGHAAGLPNVPQDAALVKCYGSVAGTLKRFWLHCLPDGFVEDAQFTASSNMARRTRDIINELATEGFKFRYQVQTAPTGRVQSIDANGNVVTLDPITGIGVSSLVQLYHVRGLDGRGKRGNYAVEAFTSEKSFKLAHWTGGAVGMSGKVRLVQFAYTGIQQVPGTGITSDPTIRPGTRKCGRPFGQLRGRAVARR